MQTRRRRREAKKCDKNVNTACRLPSSSSPTSFNCHTASQNVLQLLSSSQASRQVTTGLGLDHDVSVKGWRKLPCPLPSGRNSSMSLAKSFPSTCIGRRVTCILKFCLSVHSQVEQTSKNEHFSLERKMRHPENIWLG